MSIEGLTTHDLISSYHDGLKEAFNYVNEIIIDPLKGQLNLSEQEEAILGQFYRSHAIVSSLLRLNQKVDFNAVSVLARTMFEILLDMKLLSKKPIEKDNLERFFSFPEVERFIKAKRIIKLQEQHQELADKSLLPSSIRKEFVDFPKREDSIRLKVINLWGKTKKQEPNWPKHWTGESIASLAQKSGPIYEQEYLEMYSILSSFVHGGCNAYTGFSEETFESIYGVSLEYSRNIYIETILICTKLFGLNEVIENFPQAIMFLKNAPMEIVLQRLNIQNQ